MTQLIYAQKKIITSLMKRISRAEGIDAEDLCRRLAQGQVVIPHNNRRRIQNPCAVGCGLATKINANIGTSTDRSSLVEELKKLKVAVKYGADTVMDLSVGPDIPLVRRQILKYSPVPVGTVPIYETAVAVKKQKGDALRFDASDILEVLRAQAEDGVDFFTIHAGVTRKSLAAIKRNKRVMGIVSRGGAILAAWIELHGKENPFFEYFDQILDIARRHDVTLSLGDGLRPGSILDATDKAQIAELRILGELAQKARREGVQVMIEGPGHVPLSDIKKNILLQKKICHQAPFYVLGPLVTDVAAGYDHITSAIGGALAASYGADFLCYVTPAEHLRHPTVDDVREGVVAAKIAAHAADISKGIKSALLWDRRMSDARKARDWKKQVALALDPDRARQYRMSSRPQLSDVCTMCGDYCSIRMTEKCLGM
ncbi:MAG TPA: phosphomethylpyrimidine synthase ThiC [Patescibacteria group bacterium]|nr:phosphomethylpyrimidine synthase ThiC [Patescibacteria group bacterium]